MRKARRSHRGPGDSVRAEPEVRPFDESAAAWLIGEGVRYLNSADKEGELAYRRVTELLKDRNDTVEILTTILRQAGGGDAPLRWNLFYLLGDVGDAGAADLLAEASLEALPDESSEDACEGPRDQELLVRTMAVHALGRVAGRHPEAGEQLLRIIGDRPELSILIEAVKVARELHMEEKIGEALSEEDRWILDIKQARTEELTADPEREDGKERGFTPPRIGFEDAIPRAESRRRGDT